jgi:tetratricopeptide (TPR) repeat protein
MEEHGKFSGETPHLTEADFGLVLDAGDTSATTPLKQHLNGCSECRNRMARYQSVGESFRSLRANRGARTGAGCPEPEVWFRIAAGIEPDTARDASLDHAAGCDTCGALLKIAVEDLNSDAMPIEANSLLEKEFRDRLVEQLIQTAPQAEVIRMANRRFSRVWYAIAACLIAGVALVWALRARNSPERLIAKAFEVRRTWPVRFPDAGYVAEAAATRAESRAPAELAEADALVARNISENPASARWLQLRARVDFLNHRYDLAIQSLRQLAGDPGHFDEHLTSVYGDLGMAYLAEGAANANPADYQSALEFLGLAVRANPADPIALFNRALAQQSAFLFDGAEKDWAEYLRLDDKSGWAKEARQHWDESRQKKTPDSSR